MEETEHVCVDGDDDVLLRYDGDDVAQALLFVLPAPLHRLFCELYELHVELDLLRRAGETHWSVQWSLVPRESGDGHENGS